MARHRGRYNQKNNTTPQKAPAPVAPQTAEPHVVPVGPIAVKLPPPGATKEEIRRFTTTRTPRCLSPAGRPVVRLPPGAPGTSLPLQTSSTEKPATPPLAGKKRLVLSLPKDAPINEGGPTEHHARKPNTYTWADIAAPKLPCPPTNAPRLSNNQPMLGGVRATLMAPEKQQELHVTAGRQSQDASPSVPNRVPDPDGVPAWKAKRNWRLER